MTPPDDRTTPDEDGPTADRVAPGAPGGGLVRQLSWLFGGGAITVALPFLALPILSRLYEPTEYGRFAVWIAIAAVTAMFVGLRLETALALPRLTGGARRVLALSLSLIGVTVAVLAVAVTIALLLDVDLSWLGGTRSALVLPLAAGALHAETTLRAWALRIGRARVGAVEGITRAGATVGVQIALAPLLGGDASGLAIGATVGFVLAAFVALIGVRDALPRRAPRGGASGRRRSAFARHRRLIRAAIPTVIPQVFTTYGAQTVLAAIAGSAEAGLFAVARRVAFQPLTLLSQPIWEALHARIGRLDEAARRAVYLRTHAAVVLLFAPAGAVLLVNAELVEVVLGAKWVGIAPFVGAAGLLATCNAISNATSFFAAFGRFRAEVVFNGVLFATRIVSLVLGVWLLGAVGGIWCYALATATVYVALIGWWGSVNGAATTVILRTLGSIAAWIVIAWAIRAAALALGAAVPVAALVSSGCIAACLPPILLVVRRRFATMLID